MTLEKSKKSTDTKAERGPAGLRTLRNAETLYRADRIRVLIDADKHATSRLDFEGSKETNPSRQAVGVLGLIMRANPDGADTHVHWFAGAGEVERLLSIAPAGLIKRLGGLRTQSFRPAERGLIPAAIPHDCDDWGNVTKLDEARITWALEKQTCWETGYAFEAKDGSGWMKYADTGPSSRVFHIDGPPKGHKENPLGQCELCKTPLEVETEHNSSGFCHPCFAWLEVNATDTTPRERLQVRGHVTNVAVINAEHEAETKGRPNGLVTVGLDKYDEAEMDSGR